MPGAQSGSGKLFAFALTILAANIIATVMVMVGPAGTLSLLLDGIPEVVGAFVFAGAFGAVAGFAWRRHRWSYAVGVAMVVLLLVFYAPFLPPALLAPTDVATFAPALVAVMAIVLVVPTGAIAYWEATHPKAPPLQRPRIPFILAVSVLALTLGGLATSYLLSITSVATGKTQVTIELVATNLEVPWALAFTADQRLFVTERPGRIRAIVNGQLVPQPVAQLDVAAVGEAGLLGLAVHPDFPREPYLYVYYTYRDGQGQLWNRVARLREHTGQLQIDTTLLDRIPGAPIHDGGRLAFGPDRKLYVSTGDATQPPLAQNLASLAGKILRLNPDGSVPADNPFPGSPVYSYGHRNPQGLAWHPRTGRLYITEHGPAGHDEVNLIQPGGNYGWPTVVGNAGDSRFHEPVIESGSSTWAPAGASFVRGNRLPAWQDRLVFATLRGQHLRVLTLDALTSATVIDETILFARTYGRLRDVVQGPDGFLYVTTSNRDGRGSPAGDDDRILRIVPADRQPRVIGATPVLASAAVGSGFQSRLAISDEWLGRRHFPACLAGGPRTGYGLGSGGASPAPFYTD